MRFLALFLVLALCIPAYAAEDDVPEAIQGKWVGQDEACDAVGAPMVISADTLVHADGTIDDVYFAPEDSAIRIREEAVNYEYVADDDRLVFHPEGFGMGSAFLMQRCPDAVAASERRCGWLANLTPGDWWLVDADRTWILAEQGDDLAATIPVMDRVPGFDPAHYVATDDNHGYGCACLTVATDSVLGRITAIASSKRLPLATCQADTSLPPLSDW